jgi:hypothetical protein
MPLPLIPQRSESPIPSGWWAPVLLASLLFGSCSHKLAPEGHYQATPVVADGLADDWNLPLRFSNESYTLQYNFTNDNKNIYICILSRDEATQLRILRTGMNIYFDPKGGKNKAISINFPLHRQSEPESYRNRGGNPMPATSDSRDTRKEQWLLQSDFYNTTGFLHIENGQFAVTDQKSPIRVAMKLNNNDSVLVYELIIPIKEIPGADLNPRSERTNFSIGIVLNAVPGQDGGNGGGPRPSMGGMRGMGMGGMRGGGMGGGRRYGSSNNSPGAKEEDNWYQFRLASK